MANQPRDQRQWESGRHNEMPFHGLTSSDIQLIKRKGGAFIVDRLTPQGERGIDLMLSLPRKMLDLCTLFETTVLRSRSTPRERCGCSSTPETASSKWPE